MAIRVAINGYGRIGRNVLRALYEANRENEINIVAINDLGDAETNAHLTRFDTAHGRFPGEVAVEAGDLVVNGDRIKVLAERDPTKLPWGELDVDIVMEYNGDIAQVMQEDPDLGFVVPREGSVINSDCMCIPKGAPRPDNAHKFINFILDAKTGADIYSTIRYPTPNAAALALMPDDYRNNTAIFPPAATMAKCEYARFESIARAQLNDETLTRIFAA